MPDFSLLAIPPSAPWCHPVHTSVSPVWTHAGASSLPDSILWPPGSQINLCETKSDSFTLLLRSLLWLPVPSGHIATLRLLPQSHARLALSLIFPELTSQHQPPALCFLLPDCCLLFLPILDKPVTCFLLLEAFPEPRLVPLGFLPITTWVTLSDTARLCFCPHQELLT